MLRDRLIARMAHMREPIDYSRLAADVLGIRSAPPALARRLVSQALVIEDRRDVWRESGERICRNAPESPGVYVLRDGLGDALYVGKAVNVRRRLKSHFAPRRWRALKPVMSRVVAAAWQEVGSELEALLREAMLIRELQPAANVQIRPPALRTRAIPRALIRDVVLILPSVDPVSVELIAARSDGDVLIQRTLRTTAEADYDAARLWSFFKSTVTKSANGGRDALAPIAFSWIARRGAGTTRLDPHDSPTGEDLHARLDALVRDRQLFMERIVTL